MAKIRSLHGKPDTFEELALQLINCVPKGVNKVRSLCCLLLFALQIRTAKRKTRGENRTFQSFLKNNDNKARIIDLRLDYIIKLETKVLNILRYMKTFFPSITPVKVYPYLRLIMFSISVASNKKQIREFFHCVKYRSFT